MFVIIYSASELAEKSAQFAAFASSLPFTNTMRSTTDFQYSVLNENDPMRRSNNSISSELSHDNATIGHSKTPILPTIVESKESKSKEEELDDGNKKAEKAK